MPEWLTKFANIFVKPVLKSPLHFLLSNNLMLITFTGRKSGKVYTIPVQYKRQENTVIFLTRRERVWWKNLQDNAGVTLRLKGREVEGMVEQIVFDETQIIRELMFVFNITDQRAAEFARRMLMVRVGVGG